MSEMYKFIDAQYATSPAAPAIACMCRWLGVSKSGFYEWRSRPESATAKRREQLKLIIRKAFDDSDGTYGHRRVWAQLARWGVRAGLELVRALMRELGLVACQPRPWRPATTQQGQAGPIPDLVNRDSTAETPGAKMVGDITYIPTWEGWLCKHSPRLRLVMRAVCDQAVAGTGGLQGVPVMALRRTVRTSWPCLRAVSM